MRDIIAAVFPDYKYIRFEWSNLRETFLFEQYKWLVGDLKPKTTAIDFGSGMGDSTIYLIRSPNVSKVVAYEINTEHYKRAVDNIKEAGYKSKTTLYNEKAKQSKFPKNTIIKCDIEGAEHELFNDSFDLSKVYKIQMEYHHGVGAIPDILKGKGFKVKTKRLGSTWTLGECGMIYAQRR